MERRKFIQLTATSSAGMLLVPSFLRAQAPLLSSGNLTQDENGNCIVFIQLNGGNDGLNTFIPYLDPLYLAARPKIGLKKEQVIAAIDGMGFHPALKDLATISQEGNLTVIQNVGYPQPNRSHFRSQKIWQTASDSTTFFTNGWLGRFLDIHSIHADLPALNIDSIDNLALKATEISALTVKDFSKVTLSSSENNSLVLSDNPQLDFVRKLEYSSTESLELIAKALEKSKAYTATYAANELSKNLEWMGKLIKGNLSSKIYYTSMGGFDTHNNQLATHEKQLKILNDALFSFYQDMKQNNLLDRVTVVVFSEFGRRVAENGSGTDHGTAGPMFIIGGKNKGTLLGHNPNLSNLDKGDLIHEIDFRSVYAALLKEKFGFDPKEINIKQGPLTGLF
jgi:uncharacterized protein (DUF1501 family)